MQNLSFQIANWQAQVHADFDQPRLKIPKAYTPFSITLKHPANWSLDVQYGNLPKLEGFELVYDTHESWTLYKQGPYLWYRRPSLAGGEPGGLLRLQKNTLEATIFLRKMGKAPPQEIPFFTHPLDQLLFFYWVSCYPALIIHACGIGTGDFGYAFLGHSGWGKTTLTRLFKKHSKHHLLSDDRLIVAKKAVGVVREERQDAPPDFSERGFTPRERTDWRLFGTPWHGDARVYSPASFPLKKLIFLKHGDKNQLTPVSPSVAAAKIFAMSFPVLWDPLKTNHALSIASQMATDIPSYEFSFRPDLSAVEFLEKTVFFESLPGQKDLPLS